MRLLILGGTGEAIALASGASAAFGRRLAITTSLAGRTRKPTTVAGQLHVGGFGGARGLADYIAANNVGLVVDATHPFATTISSHAMEACAAAGVDRLVLVRPPWRRQAGDNWTEVDDVPAAATELGRRGGRAFVTVGARELQHFGYLDGVFCLVRLIERPGAPLPLGDHAVIVGRGPFDVASERQLLSEQRIDIVVSKASGGGATEAKIIAAREAGLPVIMVRRPPPPEGEQVATVAAALSWIDGHLTEE